MGINQNEKISYRSWRRAYRPMHLQLFLPMILIVSVGYWIAHQVEVVSQSSSLILAISAGVLVLWIWFFFRKTLRKENGEKYKARVFELLDNGGFRWHERSFVAIVLVAVSLYAVYKFNIVEEVAAALTEAHVQFMILIGFLLFTVYLFSFYKKKGILIFAY